MQHKMLKTILTYLVKVTKNIFNLILRFFNWLDENMKLYFEKGNMLYFILFWVIVTIISIYLQLPK